MEPETWRIFEAEVGKFFASIFSAENPGKKTIEGYEIDCWAEVGDFVFIVECKYSDPLNENLIVRKDYRSDILEFYAKKTKIHNYLNRQPKKLKPIWIFCIKGCLPTENNYTIADEHGIVIWTNEYLELLKKLKAALKEELFWQVIKECGYESEKLSLPRGQSLRFPALPRKAYFDGEEIDVYSFYIPARTLLPLSYVYRIKEDEPDSYQRLLNNKKIKDIGKFVSNGNTINTSLLINLPRSTHFSKQPGSDNFENIYGFISIPPIRNSVRIIDGQHRLYGFLHAEETSLDQKLSVIAMLGASGSQEAKAFVDINENQKTVPKNDLLVILAKTDPDGAGFIADMVIKMNDEGPFKGRIKIAGQRLSGNLKLTLTTMATVLNMNKIISLEKYTSSSIVKGNDWPTVDSAKKRAKKYIERFFLELVKTADKTSSKWSEDFILTNPGFQILIPFLREMARYSDEEPLDSVIDRLVPLTHSFFDQYTEKISDIRKDSSAAGRARYSYEILKVVNEKIPAFAAKTVERYEKATPIQSPVSRSENVIDRAIVMEEEIKNFVIEVLSRTSYGEKWFEREEAVDKRIRDHAREGMKTAKSTYYSLGESPVVRHPLFYLPLYEVKSIIKKNRIKFRDYVDAGFDQFIADVDIVRIMGNKRHEGLDTPVHEAERVAFKTSEERIKNLVRLHFPSTKVKS